MSKLILRRPSLGTILGFTALVVALSGQASAGSGTGLVRRGDIAPGAVTAKALAHGAVHPKALAKGAVTARKLGKGAVTSAALGPNSVTAVAIAPGSVHAYALGEIEIRTTPLSDPDTNADFNWQRSPLVIAQCGLGQRLLSGGVSIPAPGNNRMGITSSWPDIPSTPGTSPEGWFGQLVSDSGGGGTPAPQVVAVCLK
jgi:hypothetical protein